MTQKNNSSINIDAEFVFIINNEFNAKAVKKVKDILLKKIEANPELEEPINSIIEMLG